MGKVINVDASTWVNMLMLKDNVKALKSRNSEGKYDVAIRKESSILKSYFNEVLGREMA